MLSHTRWYQLNALISFSQANLVRQLAALISAGIPSQKAFEMCNAEFEQIPKGELKFFEITWSLATQLGGPVVLALARVAEVLESNHKNLNDIQLAFAGPKSTAKLVSGLPVVALLLAQLLGMNPIGAIISAPIAFVSVLVGSALLLLGHYWSKRLLEKAVPPKHDPGAFIDGVLIGLQAGLPLETARGRAQEEFQNVFCFGETELDKKYLDAAAELSRNSGAALSQILLANADRLRADLKYEISNRIEKLSINLMIPLGVAVLPAFILISIVPIAISLLSNGQL
ncbi:MAG: hypothetical protein F2599_03265 [Actinobacteria bacterium]|nr:hypothetical protein [Actinomycetota bacterium]